MESHIGTAVLEGFTARRATVVVRPAGRGSPGLRIPAESARDGVETQRRVRWALERAGIDTRNEALEAVLDSGALLGPEHDLAVAVAVWVRGLSGTDTDNTLVAGQLESNGAVTPAKGMFQIARLCREEALRLAGPARQREWIGEAGPLRAVLGRTVQEVVDGLADPKAEETIGPAGIDYQDPAAALDSVPADGKTKRLAAIAAAGWHHVLLDLQPAGVRLTRCLPALMGPLEGNEREEVLRIYATTGLERRRSRPLRHPHWTVASSGMEGAATGRGQGPWHPGEITLSHRGVLVIETDRHWNRSVVDLAGEAVEQGRTSNGMPGRMLLAGLQDQWTNRVGALGERFQIDARNQGESGQEHPATAAEMSRLVRQVRIAQRMQDERYGRGERNGTVPEEKLRKRARLWGRAEHAALRLADGKPDVETVLLRIARTLSDLQGTTTVLPTQVEEARELVMCRRVRSSSRKNGSDSDSATGHGPDEAARQDGRLQ